MKKLSLVLMSFLLLVGCVKQETPKEREYETTYEEVEVPFETEEVLVDDLEEGERKVVVEGKNGKVGNVYKILENGEKEFLTSWTYDYKENEVVNVGKSKEVANVDEEQEQEQQNNNGGGTTKPPTNNGGGTTKPPTNNGGGGTTKPPTNNGGGGTTKPPVEKPVEPPKPTEKPKPVHPSNTGLYFDTEEEAWNEFYRILDDWDLSEEWGRKLGLGQAVSGGGAGAVRFTDGSIKYSIEFY